MKKIFLCFLLAVSFFACSKNYPREITGEINFHSGVNSWLKIQKSVLKRDEHGLGHASLVFFNKSSSAKEFYYTIQWFSADEMAIISTLSARKIVRLAPKEQKALLIPAPSQKATNFTLNITAVK